MQLTPSLVNLIAADYPTVTFTANNEFRWSPEEKTIYYILGDEPSLFLHELGHSLLEHSHYKRDVELVTMERQAWEYAKDNLSSRYAIEISNDTIEDNLDTYRDWLHSRSICPRCQSTGRQTQKEIYACPGCRSSWRVNDARICHLRRYLLVN